MNNTGFFSVEEVGQGVQLDRFVGCGGCGLYKISKYPQQPVKGKGLKGIMIIRSYASRQNDLLKIFLRKKGIDLEKDCWELGSLACVPKEPRSPLSNEINMCRPKVWDAIKQKKPKVIFLLGESAIISFLGDRWPGGIGKINKWIGWNIPDRKANAWVCPIYPTTFLENEEKNKAIVKIWEKDILKGLALVDEPIIQWEREQNQGEIIYKSERLKEVLIQIIKAKQPIGIDFESSGLKPQAKGHFLKSCSISVNETSAYVFLIPEKGTKEYSLFQRIIKDPEISKYIQSMQFEIKWARTILGVNFQGIVWDTQLATHILDNRPGITSLKFQTYVHFGVVDYSSHLDMYLKSDKNNKGGNAFNKINQAPITELLIYNGCDTIFLYRLARLQMRLIGQK